MEFSVVVVFNDDLIIRWWILYKMQPMSSFPLYLSTNQLTFSWFGLADQVAPRLQPLRSTILTAQSDLVID